MWEEDDAAEEVGGVGGGGGWGGVGFVPSSWALRVVELLGTIILVRRCG